MSSEIFLRSNAPGQLLGYAIQFPRAVYHLLQCNKGDAVWVEVLGDVATVKANGGVVIEEDKSSINGNPVTDRSTNLWKTFSNWIKAINSDIVDIKKTKFILYCNNSGRVGIADRFHSIVNKADAMKEIQAVKEELSDIGEEHEIWEFLNFTLTENENVFAELVVNFELQIGNGIGLDSIYRELEGKLVAKSQMDFIYNSISGWLCKVVTELIAKKEPAIVQWERFREEFLVTFDQARRRELIDFTLGEPPIPATVQGQVISRPVYIQQLDLIAATDDDVLEAVSDFLRASVNREKWIANEIINEGIAVDFEEKLSKFWKNKMAELEITQKNLTASERGKLLLIQCQSRQETIRDMNPPNSTIAGTFHALANEPVLGWHSDWKKLKARKEINYG